MTYHQRTSLIKHSASALVLGAAMLLYTPLKPVTYSETSVPQESLEWYVNDSGAKEVVLMHDGKQVLLTDENDEMVLYQVRGYIHDRRLCEDDSTQAYVLERIPADDRSSIEKIAEQAQCTPIFFRKEEHASSADQERERAAAIAERKLRWA